MAYSRIELQEIHADSLHHRQSETQLISSHSSEALTKSNASQIFTSERLASNEDVSQTPSTFRIPETGPAQGGIVLWSHVFKTWRLEMLCYTLLLCSLAGLITMLRFLQNKPTPSWPHFFTINSIISILILIIKSCAALIVCEGISQLKWSWFSSNPRPLVDMATFEQASRGPLGALKLLWTLQHRHLLASLAALSTIALVILGPSSQQLVFFYSCPLELTDSHGTLPRTNLYNQPAVFIPGSEILYTRPVLNAIQASVYTTDAVPLRWTCPNGTCVMEHNYATVGWCNKCADVTDEIELFNVTDKTKQTALMAQLPSGLNATTFGEFNGTITVGYGSWPFRIGSYQTSNGNVLTSEFLYLAAWYGQGVVKNVSGVLCNANNGTSWSCQDVGAARCKTYWCAKEFHASITPSGLDEEEISRTDEPKANASASSSDLNVPSSTDLAAFAVFLPCLNDVERRDLHDRGYVFDFSTKWITWTNQTGANITGLPKECIYGVGQGATEDILVQWMNIFNGSLSVERHGAPSGSDVMRALFDGDNKSPQINYQSVLNLHNSVTDAVDRYVRQNGASNASDPVTSTMYGTTTCLQVRWIWIMVPAIFSIILLIFFATMAIQTAIYDGDRNAVASQLHSFKSSPLPLIYHGFSPEAVAGMQERGQSGKVSELEKEAQRTNVIFVQSASGWNLEEMDSVQRRRKV